MCASASVYVCVRGAGGWGDDKAENERRTHRKREMTEKGKARGIQMHSAQ